MVTEFTINELPKMDTDFTRLKVSQSLMPLFLQTPFTQEHVEGLLRRVNSSAEYAKTLERLEKSMLVKSLSDNREEFYTRMITLQQLVQTENGGSQAQLFGRLVKHYQPLLGNEHSIEGPPTILDKDATKKGIKQAIMGKQLSGTKSLKLSDFIDEKFLEDIDEVEDQESSKQTAEKKPLGAFINRIFNYSELPLLELPTGLKRQKTESAATTISHVILSPTLAIFLHQTNELLSADWKRRQVAACQLLFLIKGFSNDAGLDYFIVQKDEVSGHLTIKSKKQVAVVSLIRNMLPRLVLFILKDNFSDFEGLKVLQPAREEAMKLLAEVQRKSEIKDGQDIKPDLETLFKAMPSIFRAVEKMDDWNSQLNFFLIVKALVLTPAPGSQIRGKVLGMFGQLLIMSIPTVEDEPKVAITEILHILLPVFLQSHAKQPISKKSSAVKTIVQLLQNLTLNLQRSDEIEASSIAVFNLVCRIFEFREEYPCLQPMAFSLDLKTYCPFNFHKLEPVRYSYNLLITKCLEQAEHNMQVRDLQTLHTLTVQSLAMETSPRLIKILLKALQLITDSFPSQDISLNNGIVTGQDGEAPFDDHGQSPYGEYLQKDLLNIEKLPTWINSVQMGFESFLFINSAKFEEAENDYFKIVFRPANESEWDTFYFQKMQKLTRAVARMLAGCQGTQAANLIFDSLCSQTSAYDQNEETGEYVQRILLNQPMLVIMMTSNYYIKLLYKRTDKTHIESEKDGVLDLQYLKDLSQQFLDAQEKDVNINDCWVKEALMESLEVFINLCERSGQPLEYHMHRAQDIHSWLQHFFSTQSFQQEAEFRVMVEELNQWTAQLQDQNLSNCFLQFYAQYQSLIYFTQEYVIRLKAASASLLLNLAMMQIQKPSENVFVGQGFLSEVLNYIVKPLLHVINQERIQFIKEDAADALVQLVELLQHYQMKGPLQKTLQILIQMVEERPSELTDQRDKVLAYLVQKLIKKNKATTVYEAYGGVIGYYCLKPQWVKNERPEAVEKWLRLVLTIVKATRQSGLKTPPQNYRTFVQDALINLIGKALPLYDDEDLLPQLVDELFPSLNETQRAKLMNTLVQFMEKQTKSAFDCLNKLLDTQTSRKAGETQEFINYLPFFIIPVIKSIQVQNQIYMGEEKTIMRILAKLIQLLPLNIASINKPQEGIDQSLQKKIQEGIDFLQVFAENKIIDEYEIVVKMKNVKLRDYQRQGINWMAKLGSFNLNCALCDDMGLGKTIQSLTIIFNESEKYFQEHGVRPTSLVVCPSALTFNWLSEVNKYFEGQTAVVIEGNSPQRTALFQQLEKYDLLIVNYERVKQILPFIENHNFFYIVLDEAQKIKNAKSVVTQSCKKIRGMRKLALSGTPLQNKVSELWSLFDFLMPDFLEEETVFNRTYNKYLTANIKKMQEKLEETQQFIDALKSLKRRIAPFILRRTKEDVLKELPPKVIQDYMCTMTPLQEQVHHMIESDYPYVAGVTKTKQKTSVLQNLMLHRRVCNHPMFVQETLQKRFPHRQHLSHYENSGKLIGLVEILQECDILKSEKLDHEERKETVITESFADLVTAPQDHRALIFCQMGSFMQLIIEEILHRFDIKYMQLLSAHKGQEKVDIVEQFNTDPQYKVMILTTTVGGLGLTLTGADTVIFVEHDWNPMKDLQAMDRAHRLGQSRTVNVYRLIVKDTLEQKIMSLQRFKENLARNLITSQSADISTATPENLDLNDLLKSFEEHSVVKKQDAPQQNKKSTGKQSLASIIREANQGDNELEEIESIWGHADMANL